MRLSEEEYYQYLSIHPKLIYYAGQKMNLINASVSFNQFMSYSAEEKFPIRNSLYENSHLFDDYINAHKATLTEEENAIIIDFKHFRKGSFYVTKLTNKHALFLSDYVYGVLALNDPFEAFWHPSQLPLMVEAVLLPFKGKIIYDGIISTYPIMLGRGLTSSIKNDFNIAKAKYGVITSLPEKIESNPVNLEKELLVLMKTKSSREYNWHEIEILLDAHPELLPVYYKEWGRINTRKKKKNLKELGIKNQHFAIYDDVILTSDSTKANLEKKIKSMIKDKEILAGIYYFKV